MRISIFQLTIVAAALVMAAGAFAEDPKELREAKQAYEKASPHPSEADRARYISRLVRMREKLARGKGDGWQAVDAEIKRHPAPAESDAQALSKLVVGKWESPRHEYLFKADGVWTMLPEEEDGQKNTNGKWKIEGNQYLQSNQPDVSQFDKMTILLLDEKDFVMTDGDNVMYQKRIRK